MSITNNAFGVNTREGSAVTQSDVTTITVASGTNRALLVQVVFDVSTTSGITAVWEPTGANQSLSLISETSVAGGYGKAQLWGLLNPANVASFVRFAWTTASDIGTYASAWNGVKQTSFATAFLAATPTSGNDTTPTITITSATGNITMDCSTGVKASGWYINPSQTMTLDQGTTGGHNVRAEGSYGAGAASVTHSWSWNSGSGPWASVGVNIVADDAGGTAEGFMWL